MVRLIYDLRNVFKVNKRICVIAYPLILSLICEATNYFAQLIERKLD